MKQTGAHNELFTREYLLVAFASLMFFASLFLIMPVLPFFVLDLGGTDAQVGITVGLFTVSALAARVFVGEAVDSSGRRKFMVVGSIVFALSALLYLLPHSIMTLYLLRLAHGTGIAAFTTASTAFIADIAPAARRGEALSMFGMANNIALAVAPAAGMFIYSQSGAQMAFVAASLTSVAALVSVCLVAEPRRQLTAVHQSVRSMISVAAVFPAVTLVTGTMVYGIVVAYLPLLMDRRDLGSPGLYFTTMAVGLIAARLLGGRLSDRFGRRSVIIPGSLLMTAAMILVATAVHPSMMMVAALLHGLGFGGFYPGLLAFTVDRTRPEERGRSMAMITAAFDMGVGLGTAGLAWLAEIGLVPLFFTGALLAAAGMLIFNAGYQRRM